jgi:hypothetical protein
LISQRSIRTFGQAPDMIVALLSATACARGGLRESIGGAVANLAFLDWSHSSTGKKTPGGEYRTGKKTPGEPGHTRDTHGTRGRTRAHGAHRRTSQLPSKPANTQPVSATARPATTETAADSTAAGPEPTAPRGRLRRGRPQRTRPCLHPLPVAPHRYQKTPRPGREPGLSP